MAPGILLDGQRKPSLAPHQSQSTRCPRPERRISPHSTSPACFPAAAAATGSRRGEGIGLRGDLFRRNSPYLSINSVSTEPMEADRSQLSQIDPRRARFPCCIVWTPIPFISWLVPFIGHIGICREDGVTLDFAGPNFVSVDNFAFGAVARYIQVNGDECYKLLNPEVDATWDDTLKKGVQEFQNRNYNLFTCNCHSFVANNLNRLFYSGHDKWNVVSLAAVMFLRGRWVSAAAMVKTFLPFVVVLSIGTLLGGTTFLVGLLAFAAVMTSWFLVGTYCIKGLVEL